MAKEKTAEKSADVEVAAPTTRKRLTSEQLAALKEDLEAGKNKAELATKFDVSYATILNQARKFGFGRAPVNNQPVDDPNSLKSRLAKFAMNYLMTGSMDDIEKEELKNELAEQKKEFEEKMMSQFLANIH